MKNDNVWNSRPAVRDKSIFSNQLCFSYLNHNFDVSGISFLCVPYTPFHFFWVFTRVYNISYMSSKETLH